MDPGIHSPSRLTLITGPVRSGKTRLALEIARSFPPPRLYLATAQALDDEMAERIHRHRQERGSDFQTIEEPLQISHRLQEFQDPYSVIVVDCLTLWLSNVLGAGGEGLEFQEIMGGLTGVLRNRSIPLILISNEVGWGIVPENTLARTFRDLSGRLNQSIAQIADRVILMVAGLPLVMKGNRG
ncbi:MAG: bifunctional adenosylcobinamide kinase/adenosylcobinamide-phosphate guanylyltransferase [Thermodesulfobacteriota bacterium]